LIIEQLLGWLFFFGRTRRSLDLTRAEKDSTTHNC
jgi:hypothetical protein